MKEESTQGLYEETVPKIEEDQEDEETPDEVVEQSKEYRRSRQNRVANRQYQDYKLYVTVEEEDNQRDVEEDPKEDPKRLASIAHYIMMPYAKKESVKKKQLEAGLKHFGERSEMAVSKELKQFNVYNVFEPLYADKLSQEEKSKALTSLIFLKE